MPVTKEKTHRGQWKTRVYTDKLPFLAIGTFNGIQLAPLYKGICSRKIGGFGNFLKSLFQRFPCFESRAGIVPAQNISSIGKKFFHERVFFHSFFQISSNRLPKSVFPRKRELFREMSSNSLYFDLRVVFWRILNCQNIG